MVNIPISPLIESQFPDFYREYGPNFISFVQAYYEWAEQTNLLDDSSGEVGKIRSLPEYLDVDTTSQQFISHFAYQYLQQLPTTIACDKSLLIKHIIELYRTKGTPRSYELLFRILFNEPIEIYLPKDYLFKTSDGIWIVPQYIEVTDCPLLYLAGGRQLTNSARTATAIIEGYYQKNVAGKIIGVLTLSNVVGQFRYGESVLCSAIPSLTIANAPTIIGSLTAIAIENGGANFKQGDVVSITGAGSEGTARIAATKNESGKVSFDLINGGTMFSMNAIVTVATSQYLQVSNTFSQFNLYDTIVDTTTNANGTVTFANTSLIQIINFSANLAFGVGHQVSNGAGSLATVTGVIGGGGVGATFRIGGLTNIQTVSLNTDTLTTYTTDIIDNGTSGVIVYYTSNTGLFSVNNTVTSTSNVVILPVTTSGSNVVSVGEALSNSSLGISGLRVYNSDGSYISVTGTDVNLTSANLVAGATLVSNTSGSIVTLIDNTPKITVTGNGTISSSNSTAVVLNSVAGAFIPYGLLHDNTTSANATIQSVTRQTNWSFPSRVFPLLTNLDTVINSALQYQLLQVGTIAYLTGINPGSGYSSPPYIDIIEPAVAGYNIGDGFGGFSGHDASIKAMVTNANGIATAVEVINSGFGFVPGETVYLASNNNSGIVATGVAIVDQSGTGEGYWQNSNGKLSDITKLQDSFYYQTFSYEIIAQRMLSTYQQVVKDLLHPVGLAMFGRYRLTDVQLNNGSMVVSSTVTTL